MRFIPRAIAFGVGAYVVSWLTGIGPVMAVGMLLGALFIAFQVWLEDTPP